jgi:hypothetical protein
MIRPPGGRAFWFTRSTARVCYTVTARLPLDAHKNVASEKPRGTIATKACMECREAWSAGPGAFLRATRDFLGAMSLVADAMERETYHKENP